MPRSFAPSWRVCADDPGQHADLACGRSDGYAPGFTSLSGLVQSALDKSPLSGQVFIFRGRRGDLIKLIWHDGDGMCLFLEAS